MRIRPVPPDAISKTPATKSGAAETQPASPLPTPSRTSPYAAETQPASPLPTPSRTSPYAAENKPLSPFDPNNDRMAAARWLFDKGWKPLGSPHFEYTRWWDPTRSKQDAYRKEVRQALHLKGWNDQTKQYDYHLRPVMVKDAHGQPVPCEQTVLIPAGVPYPINLAMEIQLAREQEAQEKEADNAPNAQAA